MLKVAPIFSDGAVLCRRKEIRIFGEAEEGAEVRCELRDEKGRQLARGCGQSIGGQFLICLPAQEAAEGCTLTVEAGNERFRAGDLAVGEVFLAGGQSNMELELRNADGGRELIPVHSDPQVRYFNVPKRAYFCGEAEEAFRNARWRKVAPGSAEDMSAVAYFFAVKLRRELDVPVGIIDCYWGGTSVTAWMNRDWLCRTAEGKRYLDEYEQKAGNKDLEQYLKEEAAFQAGVDAWNEKAEKYRAEHPQATGAEVNAAVGHCPWCPPAGPGSPYRPAALFDTMVARVAPAGLNGILFYQGEEDAGRTDQYDVLLTAMADCWRTAFRDNGIPFLIVQLPMWIDAGAKDTFTWPVIRLAQAKVRDTLKNCAMVSLPDQGEYDNIHPTDKKPVGDRLCELAKAEIYGLPGKRSPRAVNKQTDGDALSVILDMPVRTADGKAPALLEIAGDDGCFVPAEAEADGAVLRLKAADVPHPSHARYAWTDYGTVNLFGENGLPLEPFRM